MKKSPRPPGSPVPRRATPPAAGSAAKTVRRVNPGDGYGLFRAKLASLCAQNDEATNIMRDALRGVALPPGESAAKAESTLLSALEEKRRLTEELREARAECERKSKLLAVLERLSNLHSDAESGHFRAISEDGLFFLSFSLAEDEEECRVTVHETNLPDTKELQSGIQLKFTSTGVHDFFCLVFLALNEQLLKR